MQKKIGRPKKKKSELKRHFSLRLNSAQVKILMRHGETKQKAVDNILDFAEKNYYLFKAFKKENKK